MPLFKYRPEKLPCRICGSGFEVVQRSDDALLNACPTCGASVRRDQTATVSAPKITRAISPSDVRGAGFKVFKRTSDGGYERK